MKYSHLAKKKKEKKEKPFSSSTLLSNPPPRNIYKSISFNIFGNQIEDKKIFREESNRRN
jgi:hypothetical protein